ncbi:MAG: DUF928 domain-containing protein [Cyanobacteria bacterium P01_F01_bin.150]
MRKLILDLFLGPSVKRLFGFRIKTDRLNDGVDALRPRNWLQGRPRQLAAGLFFTSLTMVPATAWAQPYQPPTGDPPSGSILSSGTRDSCGENYEIPLTVLAPAQHVGQTSTTTPTLTWFVPTTDSYRIQLSLYTIHDNQPPALLQQIQYVEDDAGIVSFTLPEEEFQLNPGQRYLWEVNLACTPDAPMYSQLFVSELEIQEPSASLLSGIAAAQTPLERAEIYAGAGYWYDTLREALIAAQNPDTDDLARSLLYQLAESEGGIHGQFLTQIADTM